MHLGGALGGGGFGGGGGVDARTAKLRANIEEATSERKALQRLSTKTVQNGRLACEHTRT